jgi:hypothetical protein
MAGIGTILPYAEGQVTVKFRTWWALIGNPRQGADAAGRKLVGFVNVHLTRARSQLVQSTAHRELGCRRVAWYTSLLHKSDRLIAKLLKSLA